MKTFKKVVLFVTALALALPTVMIATSSEAEARSYRSPSRSYNRPKAPTKKVTVVQNNTVNRGSSSGGMLSTMAGTMGGVVAGNAISDWMRSDDENQQPQTVPQPMPNQVQPVQHCPEGYACDFTNGKFFKLPTE